MAYETTAPHFSQMEFIPQSEVIKWFPLFLTSLTGYSLLSLALRYLLSNSSKNQQAKKSTLHTSNDTHASSTPHAQESTARRFLKAFRLLCVLALLVISIYGIIMVPTSRRPFIYAVIAFYTYTSFLAGVTFLSPNWQDLTSFHLTVLLLLPTISGFSQLVLPLLFIGGQQSPKRPLWFVWPRFCLLVLSAIVIPAFTPAKVVTSGAEPAETPSASDRASLFMRITYGYLDPLVFRAYRKGDLSTDEMPAIPRQLTAENLAKKGLPRLDPLIVDGKPSIFWGLASAFRGTVLQIILWAHVSALTRFFAAFGLNNLLSYLETGVSLGNLRAGVWIAFIAFGPVAYSMADNNYLASGALMAVQTEGALTQLIYEHASRIRLTSSSENEKSDAVSSTSGSDGTATPVPKAEKEKEKSKHLIGKINSLLTSDVASLSRAHVIVASWALVVELIVANIFLYKILGWSALVGFAVLVVSIPLPARLTSFMMGTQKEKMKKTDERVQAVTETMNVLRMIKLFAWESRALDQISEKRDSEISLIRRMRLLELALFSAEKLMPIISSVATYATFTVVMKQELTASRAFASIAIFQNIKDIMAYLLYYVPELLRVRVSFTRFDEVLHETEYLSNASQTTELTVPEDENVGFNATRFSWHNPQIIAAASGRFTLLIEKELVFQKGSINLIVGPTASGKTSMLMALLGEMYHEPLSSESWYSLPRSGGIAYAPQESWVLNTTIRENIVFSGVYDETRYKKVLKQCALERDLELWAAGDLTEVGEKGLTLSGGQKARVTLARALYSDAEILLLDDILSALDVHTAKWIVDEALRGDLMRGRTTIVVLTKNGRIERQGLMKDVITQDASIRAAIATEDEELKKAEQAIDVDGAKPEDEGAKKTAGKLVVAEEKGNGPVGMAALMVYIQYGGWIWFLLFVFWRFIETFVNIAQMWFMGYWASQYDERSPSEVPVLKYVGIYALILLSRMPVDSAAQISWLIGSTRGSRVIHKKLLESIVNATFRWLDTVPVGRVITRCTQDIGAIDGSMVDSVGAFMSLTTMVITPLVTAIYMTGWLAFVSGVVTMGLGGFLGRVYLVAQMSVRQQMSMAKSPVLSHVGTVLAGLPSIRAYGAQNMFRKELGRRQDLYIGMAVTFFNIQRWISIRMDMLGGIFSAVLACYLVYASGIGPEGLGFIFNIVLSFAAVVLNWVKWYNRLEVEANSVERVLGYLDIDHEPSSIPSGVPPAYWPASGSLRVEGLSARYSSDSPEVLHDLTFEIKSGERVGIVGRTGAGKSTVALSILRAINTSGKVYYDNLATDTLNLDALRAAITLIPQQPELLHGTLRENLDPYAEHDDSVLNDALRSAGLFDVQDATQSPASPAESDHRVSLGLDSVVENGGSNFSLGQRQIIALARAIVRRSHLLILDEATAAIDYRTDVRIQQTLRTELKSGTTLLTVAHRLQTIMDYDKILVLDAGRIVEFDTPQTLLQNDQGYLRALVNESGDKERLEAMASAKRSSD